MVPLNDLDLWLFLVCKLLKSLLYSGSGNGGGAGVGGGGWGGGEMDRRGKAWTKQALDLILCNRLLCADREEGGRCPLL